MRRVSRNICQKKKRKWKTVTPRMRRVSRNDLNKALVLYENRSRLVWGVWVEIVYMIFRLRYMMSRLVWGVWVEILLSLHWWAVASVTPRMRRVSRNDKGQVGRMNDQQASRLVWGVWVEMLCRLQNRRRKFVTPRMRRVSRNVVGGY